MVWVQSLVGCLVCWYWIRCGIVFDSDGQSSWVAYTPSQPPRLVVGWCVLVVSWLRYGLFLVGDYLWRQEKHINRESYNLRGGECLVNMLVGISRASCSLVIVLSMLACTPCFFDNYGVSLSGAQVLCHKANTLYPFVILIIVLGMLFGWGIGCWNGVVGLWSYGCLGLVVGVVVCLQFVFGYVALTCLTLVEQVRCS